MNKFFVMTVITILAGTLCQCQRLGARNALRDLRNSVQWESNLLRFDGDNLILRIKMRLSDVKRNQMKNIKAAVDRERENLRNDIAAAEREGRNADHCYEPTKRRLQNVSMELFAILDECLNDEIALLDLFKNNIDTEVMMGRHISDAISHLVRNCPISNRMQAEMCIAQQAIRAAPTLNRYKETAKQLKSEGDSLLISVPASAYRCFERNRDFYSAISEARMSDNKCILNS